MSKEPVSSEAYDDEWITAAWGDQANQQLLKKTRIQSRPRIVRAMALADIQSGQTILDIACGRGEVPAIACQKGASGIGLDYSEASLQFASRVREVHGSGAANTMELVRADASILPFESESFDRVTMLDIIEHLVPDQLDAMFREVYRVLKTGGYAVIHTLPNRWVYDITYPMLHRISGKLPANPRGAIERKVHINEQDIPKLNRTLSKTGFKYRLWLEQYIPAQARWNAGTDHYDDNRSKIYPVLAGVAGRLLELISKTPLKLLICNDIFGVLWKGEKLPLNGKLPLALTERLTCQFLTKNRD